MHYETTLHQQARQRATRIQRQSLSPHTKAQPTEETAGDSVQGDRTIQHWCPMRKGKSPIERVDEVSIKMLVIVCIQSILLFGLVFALMVAIALAFGA